MATPRGNRIILAIITPVLSVSIGFIGKYLDSKIETNKKQRENFEVFVSDMQDQINCRLDSLRENKCKQPL